jgi:hypothetical protein
MATMNCATFNIEATYLGAEGIETDVLAIEASCLLDALAVAAREINGLNSFADCLLGLEVLHVLPIED